MICLLVTSNLSIRSWSAGCYAVNNVQAVYTMAVLFAIYFQIPSLLYYFYYYFNNQNNPYPIISISQTPLQLVRMVHKLDIPGSERCEENYATRPAAAARMKLDDHPCPFKAS